MQMNIASDVVDVEVEDPRNDADNIREQYEMQYNYIYLKEI